MTAAKIRALQNKDFSAWLPLWDANCLHMIGADVTDETWKRLCDPRSPVNGFGAFVNGDLAGILHYILHPTTGHIEPVCYMQDLYIGPAYRRQGIARGLVETLAETGKKQGWTRVYWLAEANNPAAQNLYKTLGVKVDFTLHILPIT